MIFFLFPLHSRFEPQSVILAATKCPNTMLTVLIMLRLRLTRNSTGAPNKVARECMCFLRSCSLYNMAEPDVTLQCFLVLPIFDHTSFGKVFLWRKQPVPCSKLFWVALYRCMVPKVVSCQFCFSFFILISFCFIVARFLDFLTLSVLWFGRIMLPKYYMKMELTDGLFFPSFFLNFTNNTEYSKILDKYLYKVLSF